jgi:nucleoside-diphosphate-sugar epimerase
MSRTLITGGAGFVGRHFIERLAAAGAEVTILDLVRPAWDVGRARVVVGDVRDAATVRDALAGCDRVLHLAAAHHDFGIARETYFAVNEGSARVLCAEMDAAGVRDLCFFSTVAVYGNAAEPITEATAPQPASPYGASKLAGEAVFRAWAALGAGRRALVIRPTVIFGPRHFANMYTLIRQIASGRFVRVGAGTNVKSLVYIDNVIDATLALWGRPDAPAFDVVNAVDKPDLTSGEITDAIAEALGRPRGRLSIPLGAALALAIPFDVVIKVTGRNLPISGARVRKLFAAQTKFEAERLGAAGITPRVTLRDGLARMVRWYLAEGRATRPVWHIP